MTKDEAIAAMLNGEKIAHRHFGSDEWMKQNRDGRLFTEYEFEDGCICTGVDFWSCRSDISWQDGWRIWA